MATSQITAWNPVVRPHPLAPLRTRLCRIGICLLVVCNVAAAGTAVYGARAVLTNPGSIAPSANTPVAATAGNVEDVRTFYAAVNDAIRTGDASPLDALVASRLSWCLPCPAQAPDREGLKRYVTDLHRLSPEMRLVVDEVVGGLSETVSVRVHVSGYPVAGPP